VNVRIKPVAVALLATAALVAASPTPAFASRSVDRAGPTLRATKAPRNGAQVSGSVAFAAAASDRSGVRAVDLYINGAFAVRDTRAPYTFSVNAARYDSRFTWRLRATDSKGNTTWAATQLAYTPRWPTPAQRAAQAKAAAEAAARQATARQSAEKAASEAKARQDAEDAASAAELPYIAPQVGAPQLVSCTRADGWTTARYRITLTGGRYSIPAGMRRIDVGWNDQDSTFTVDANSSWPDNNYGGSIVFMPESLADPGSSWAHHLNVLPFQRFDVDSNCQPIQDQPPTPTPTPTDAPTQAPSNSPTPAPEVPLTDQNPQPAPSNPSTEPTPAATA
jgi:hypothetical protein